MRFLLGLGVLTWLCWGQIQQPTEDAPELASVNISVSTTFGQPLSNPTVILREIGPTAEYKKSGDNGGIVRFDGISFGLYDLEVYVAGFNTRRERLGVYQAKLNLSVGLVVAPLDDSRPSEITGAITQRKGNPAALWVRLVPLYSSDFLEDHVTPAGTFHLSHLYPGRFVLLVFDRKSLIITKAVDYRGGKLTLNLDVPDRN
jgi:hypothetical protein